MTTEPDGGILITFLNLPTSDMTTEPDGGILITFLNLPAPPDGGIP
jgi:hypothetical protein